MPTIATWNVNSIRARLDHLLAWLRAAGPDIVLLQELKVAADGFPHEAVGDAGYNAAVVGQPAYNGVAVLAKRPIDVEATALPGDDGDDQARYLEVFTGELRVASLYLPNGNPVGSDKFAYKLAWMARLVAHVRKLLEDDDAFVLGGDFNVAPTEADVWDKAATADDALCQPETRAAFRRLLHLGLTDAIARSTVAGSRFTWWDYRARAFAGDQGMRIDHLLLSPRAADRLVAAGIDRAPRGWDKPSDHTPVWCELAAAAP
jgi:exodeoxyribonuclease-3